MNGLAETNSTPIFLFFESMLKLMKIAIQRIFQVLGEGSRGTKTGNIRGIPGFLENRGTSRPNRGTLFPGNMQLTLKYPIKVFTLMETH